MPILGEPPFTTEISLRTTTKQHEFCDEFILGDLRDADVAHKATEKADYCYNLAADMGGMGFIQSNHSLILYNNTMISVNVLEACRANGVCEAA